MAQEILVPVASTLFLDNQEVAGLALGQMRVLQAGQMRVLRAGQTRVLQAGQTRVPRAGQTRVLPLRSVALVRLLVPVLKAAQVVHHLRPTRQAVDYQVAAVLPVRQVEVRLDQAAGVPHRIAASQVNRPLLARGLGLAR